MYPNRHVYHIDSAIWRACYSQVYTAYDPDGATKGAQTTVLCRCNRISSGDGTTQIGISACNINASANYMVCHCA